jgi:hypothetical protein
MVIATGGISSCNFTFHILGSSALYRLDCKTCHDAPGALLSKPREKKASSWLLFCDNLMIEFCM